MKNITAICLVCLICAMFYACVPRKSGSGVSSGSSPRGGGTTASAVPNQGEAAYPEEWNGSAVSANVSETGASVSEKAPNGKSSGSPVASDITQIHPSQTKAVSEEPSTTTAATKWYEDPSWQPLG